MVKMPIDALGQRPADAFHLRDVVPRGCLHAAQTAEVLDQRLATLGANPRNLIQHRRGALFAAPRTARDDSEAVRLVADRLDQVEPRVGRSELERPRFGLDDQLFEAGLSFSTLRAFHHAYLVQSEIGEHAAGYAHLPFPAVDQDE